MSPQHSSCELLHRWPWFWKYAGPQPMIVTGTLYLPNQFLEEGMLESRSINPAYHIDGKGSHGFTSRFK